MNDAEFVERRVKLAFPRAKFVAYSPSSSFIDPSAGLDFEFHHVSLYDDDIRSNALYTLRGPVLLQNSYLSSHAYNLFACWLLGSEWEGVAAPIADQQTLLMHNFKKFYAEQLLRQRNSIFSRAVLLETLLFEQRCMIPVFQAQADNADLNRLASLGASLMSSLTSFHEFGHLIQRLRPESVLEELGSYGEGILPFLEVVERGQSPRLVEEIRSDVFAIMWTIKHYEDGVDFAFCIPAIAFAYAAFAVLSSLKESATVTMAHSEHRQEDVDFNSIQKLNRDYTYAIGEVATEFVLRAQIAIELCAHVASERNLHTSVRSHIEPPSVDLIQALFNISREVMESSDVNAREMSLLVAEALHEHPRGLEFLKLRSRTFNFGPGRNADGSLKND